MSHNIEMCDMLVMFGAERGSEDKAFKSPWDYAEAFFYPF